MGGCRCTYRNCNVKSDGKTHMFHFPVFDKVRCHQWLMNAQRLDFLDLKVSQLKNRCICQHHFKTENFMNFKKDKLTFDAVPTLNGPYCDPSKDGLGDRKKTYPNLILIEDIENDFDINDKKSNFSLKYADFLTNNEFVDSSARYNRNNISQTKDNTGINLNTNSNIKDKDKTLFEPYYTRLELPTKNIKKKAPQQMMMVPPYSDYSNELKMGKELNLEQSLTDLQSNSNLQGNHSKAEFGFVSSTAQPVVIAPNSNQELSDEFKMDTQLNLEQNLTDPLSNLNLEDKCSKLENTPFITSVQSVESVDTASQYKELMLKRRPKVKILSEKKIKDPINIGQIPGKFEIISPSRPLSLPYKSHIIPKNEEPQIPKSFIVESEIKPSEKLKVLEVLDVQFEPEKMKAGPIQNDVQKASAIKIENIAPKSPPKKSTPVKNKVTPERSAAIEKKRKFNMKLKDIIETCLDKLDDPLKNYEISPNLINNVEKPILPSLINNLDKPPVNTTKESIKPMVKGERTQPTEKVISHLAEHKNLPNIQDITIAYLEERMKKMESTLLNKIAQNSQQIIDFKNSLTKDSSPVGKKRKEQSNKRVVSTQTNESESSYKKFLYQEISKYLSPSSNSVIYEELFINKYLCDKVENPSKRKRRRCI